MYHCATVFLVLLLWHPPASTLFPYTTLFRSSRARRGCGPRTSSRDDRGSRGSPASACASTGCLRSSTRCARRRCSPRSEEHTSELQSRFDLVCRLLLEKKNID